MCDILPTHVPIFDKSLYSIDLYGRNYLPIPKLSADFSPRPLRPKGCRYLRLSICLSVSQSVCLFNSTTQSVYPINQPNLHGGFGVALSWLYCTWAVLVKIFMLFKDKISAGWAC